VKYLPYNVHCNKLNSSCNTTVHLLWNIFHTMFTVTRKVKWMLVVCACVKLQIVIPLCTNTPQFIIIHCFRITHSHFSSQSNYNHQRRAERTSCSVHETQPNLDRTWKLNESLVEQRKICAVYIIKRNKVIPYVMNSVQSQLPLQSYDTTNVAIITQYHEEELQGLLLAQTLHQEDK